MDENGLTLHCCADGFDKVRFTDLRDTELLIEVNETGLTPAQVILDKHALLQLQTFLNKFLNGAK